MKNMLKFILIPLSLLLTSCVGSNMWQRNLEVTGSLAIEPSKEYGADYRVKFRDVIDFGYDGDNRDDRIKVLNSYVSNQCPNGYKITREETVKTGKWTSGSSSEDYFIYLKCNSKK